MFSPLICTSLLLLYGKVYGEAVWARYRGNAQNTGISRYNVSGPLPLRLKWRVPMQSTPDLSSPSVTIRQDSELYFASGTDDTFYALNHSNGATLYSFNSGNAIYPSAAIDHDGFSAYVASSTGNVTKLDAMGNAVWAWTNPSSGGFYASVALGGSSAAKNGTVYLSVYLSTTASSLIALNSTTGLQIWERIFSEQILAQSPALSADERIVYHATGSATLWALHAVTGAVLWSASAGPSFSVDSTSPVVGGDGTVYVAANSLSSGAIFVFNGTTGKQLWNFTVLGYLSIGSPAVDAGNAVYVGSSYSWVYAVRHGVQEWKAATTGSSEGSITLSNDGLLFIGDNGGVLHCYDTATGGYHGAYQTGSSTLHTAPAIGTDGTVYFWTSDNAIVALSMQYCDNGSEFQDSNAASCVPCPPNMFNGNATAGGVCVRCPAATCSRGGAAACSAAACLAPPPTSPGPDYQPGAPWPKEFGAAGNTGVSNASSTAAAVSAPGTLPLLFQEAWCVHLSWNTFLRGPTVAAGGTVYVSDAFVRALNGSNGVELWEFDTGEVHCRSPALGPAGLVFVGCEDGRLLALSNATGALQWSYQVATAERGNFLLSAIALGFGSVFAGDGGPGQRLYSLAQSTGALRWYFATPFPIDTSPAIYGSSVYIVSNARDAQESFLYALDGQRGTLLWAFPLPSTTLSPVVDNGIVYLLSGIGQLHLVSSINGTLLVGMIILGQFSLYPPTALGGLLFIFGSNSNVTAADGRSGVQVWTQAIDRSFSPTPALIADAASGLLYAVQGNKIRVFDAATGVLRSVYEHTTVIAQHSVGVGGALVFSGADDSFCTLQPTFCPAGHYFAVTNVSIRKPASYCAPCDPGSFLAQPSCYTNCTLCPANSFASAAGATYCMPCAPGEYAPPGASSCSILNITWTSSASMSGSASPSPTQQSISPSPFHAASLPPSPSHAASLFPSLSPLPTMVVSAPPTNESSTLSSTSSSLPTFTPSSSVTPSVSGSGPPLSPGGGGDNVAPVSSSSSSPAPIIGSVSAILSLFLLALCARAYCLLSARRKRRLLEVQTRNRIQTSLERGRAANNALAVLLAASGEEKRGAAAAGASSSAATTATAVSSPPAMSNALQALFFDGLGGSSSATFSPITAAAAVVAAGSLPTPQAATHQARLSEAVAEALLLELVIPSPEEEVAVLREAAEGAETPTLSTSPTTAGTKNSTAGTITMIHGGGEHVRDTVVRVQSQRGVAHTVQTQQIDTALFNKRTRIMLTPSLARTFAAIVLNAAATVAARQIIVGGEEGGEEGPPPLPPPSSGDDSSSGSKPGAASFATTGGAPLSKDETFMAALLSQAFATLDQVSSSDGGGEAEEVILASSGSTEGGAEVGEIATAAAAADKGEKDRLVKSPSKGAHKVGAVVGISIELSSHIKHASVGRSLGAIRQDLIREVHQLLAKASKGEIMELLTTTAKATTRIVATEVVSRLTEQDMATIQSAAVLGVSVEEALPAPAGKAARPAHSLGGASALVSAPPLSPPWKTGGVSSAAENAALELLLQQQLPPQQSQATSFFLILLPLPDVCLRCLKRPPPSAITAAVDSAEKEQAVSDKKSFLFSNEGAGGTRPSPALSFSSSTSRAPPLPSSLLLDFCDARKPRAARRPNCGGSEQDPVKDTAAILALVISKRLHVGGEGDGGASLLPSAASGNVDLLNPMHAAAAAAASAARGKTAPPGAPEKRKKRGSTAKKIAGRLNFLATSTDTLPKSSHNIIAGESGEEDQRISMQPMKGRSTKKPMVMTSSSQSPLLPTQSEEALAEGGDNEEEEEEEDDGEEEKVQEGPAPAASAIIAIEARKKASILEKKSAVV